MTSFIGREQETALALSLLRRSDVRLLTLTGPGGIGKTRLAIRVAEELAGTFREGIRFVSLAEATSAEDLGTVVAQALGIVPPVEPHVTDVLTFALRDQHLLLVIDSAEHVLAAVPLLTDLLGASPGLKILVTSRILLRLDGEQVLPVPPLDLPESRHRSPAEIAHSSAVALFINRARAAVPTFEFTSDLAPTIVELCRHLDGLPLAIELAAAQTRILSPDQVLARVRDRLPLPLSGPRDVPQRLRSVRETIAWSFDLLDRAEQSLLRRLGVFSGGFSIGPAEAIWDEVGGMTADDDRTDRAFLDVLATLVDSCLVERDALATEPRFTMLATIRGFALEQLASSPEERSVRDAHAAWCIALAERARPAVAVLSNYQGLSSLEIEHPNLRAALHWLSVQGDATGLIRLAHALSRFWLRRGFYAEGRSWLEQALKSSPDLVAPDTRTELLVDLGRLLYLQGQRERAEATFKEGASAFQRSGNVAAQVGVLIWQGWMECLDGSALKAEAVLNEALGLVDSIAEPVIASSARAIVISNLGLAAHVAGHLEIAHDRYLTALTICQQHGDIPGMARSLCDLADVARDQGNHKLAVACYREALSSPGDQIDPRIIVDALRGAAMAAAVWDRPVQAAGLLGASDHLRRRLGLEIVAPTDRAAVEYTLTALRIVMTEDQLQDSLHSEREWSLQDVITEIEGLERPGPATSPSESDAPLSPRQLAVLRLLAAGRTDREIAAELSISVRTAEGHVARLIARLGASSRVDAVRIGSDSGFLTLPRQRT